MKNISNNSAGVQTACVVQEAPIVEAKPSNTKAKSSLIKKPYLVAFLATALDHYDVALYGFMAPVLTSVFLPMLDRVHALILAYCITPLGMISRPLGALLIGSIGDKWGRKKALLISVWGMIITTTLIGFLPTYVQIGALAPILFGFFKLIQDFFLAGSYSGGAIFALEHIQSPKKGFWSGLYICATVIGILLASLAATVVAHLPEGYWRLAYMLALFTGLLAMYIRKHALESPEFLKAKPSKTKRNWSYFKSKLPQMWQPITGAILVTFCYSTLTKMVQVFMNVFILQVTSIPLASIMTVHTAGLFVFLLALPMFGKLADSLSLGKSMLYGSLSTIALSFPLFKLLELDSLLWLICMKLVFVLLSAWFVAPFHAWAYSLFPVEERYTFISFSYAIGARVGSAMIPFALYLWHKTELCYLPCIVLILGAILGAVGVCIAKPKM